MRWLDSAQWEILAVWVLCMFRVQGTERGSALVAGLIGRPIKALHKLLSLISSSSPYRGSSLSLSLPTLLVCSLSLPSQ